MRWAWQRWAREPGIHGRDLLVEIADAIHPGWHGLTPRAARQVDASGDRERRRVDAWCDAQRNCPQLSVRLPPELRRWIAASRQRLVWLHQAVYQNNLDDWLGDVASLAEVVAGELERPEWAPLNRRAEPGSEPQPARVAAALLVLLQRGGALAGSSGRYRAISITLSSAREARVSVEVPEHVAETGIDDIYFHWPAAKINAYLQLEGGYPTNENVLATGFSCADLDGHPLLSSSNLPDRRERAVCVADTAVRRAFEMSHAGHGAGVIAAEQLLAVQRTILCGYHQGSRRSPYRSYESIIYGGPAATARWVYGSQTAEALARERHIELVRWVR